MSIGKVVQVIGPVVDIRFEEGYLPSIYNAIKIDNNGKELIAEVMQHIGDDTVRTIAMDTTDGLTRGAKAEDTGAAILFLLRKDIGKTFNVLGKAIDNCGEVNAEEYYPIHRPAPSFEEQSVQPEMFETGIKVIDLLAPYQRGGKIGLLVVQGLVKQY